MNSDECSNVLSVRHILPFTAVRIIPQSALARSLRIEKQNAQSPPVIPPFAKNLSNDLDAPALAVGLAAVDFLACLGDCAEDGVVFEGGGRDDGGGLGVEGDVVGFYAWVGVSWWSGLVGGWMRD